MQPDLRSSLRTPILITAAVLAASTPALADPPERFTLTIDPAALDRPYTGRLYIAFLPADPAADPNSDQAGDPAARATEQPIDRVHDWFNAPPLAAWDVEDLAPGDAVTLEFADALFHTSPAFEDAWGSGQWQAQAFARVNQDTAKPGTGAGDPYSEPVVVPMGDPQQQDPQALTPALTLTATIEAAPFPESDADKLYSLRSARLSNFHGRDITMNAAVRLPTNYHETLAKNPSATFPVVYIVTGFGGSHHELDRYAGFYTRGADPELLKQTAPIIVVPDATNYWGHSVFANSEVTGPWGDALVDELIPALEDTYRGSGPDHRYVTGVSSGGWSSLWLQIEYPDRFAGCWAHAPDAVDFRAFQTPNLYQPDANIYTNADGNPRPIARRTDPNGVDQVMLTARDFIARETVMGPGGQIESFEAVFSPARPDGTPQRLFDRDTGDISSETANAWRPYDITQKTLREMHAKAPDLAGKVRVFGGELDNFYLGESVRLFRDDLLEAGVTLASADNHTAIPAQADIRVIEGMPHTLHADGNRAMWATIGDRWQTRHDQER
ncbi:MAG: alpha/beta hydrolase-fold protein [Planctomycetota bacterium]